MSGPLVLSQAEPTELHSTIRAGHFIAALVLLDEDPTARTGLCGCDHSKITDYVLHSLRRKQRRLTRISPRIATLGAHDLIVAAIEVRPRYVTCILATLTRALQDLWLLSYVA